VCMDSNNTKVTSLGQGRAVAWLRHYATSWKVTGSIPHEGIGFLTRPNPGVESGFNRNEGEYQESSWG
jgi:hypothetical protein